MDYLVKIDEQLFLFFNGMHSSFFDEVMWWVSDTFIWAPFYILLYVIILRKRWGNNVRNYKTAVLVLLVAGLTILLTDQLTSGFMKPFFERLRPSHEPGLEGLVHLVADENGNLYRGGTYGFASSHAANAFAIAVYVASLIRGRVIWVVMIFWAALVAYSRIYLGVHYPGDVLAGAAIGSLIAWLTTKIYYRLEKTLYKRA